MPILDKLNQGVIDQFKVLYKRAHVSPGVYQDENSLRAFLRRMYGISNKDVDRILEAVQAGMEEHKNTKGDVNAIKRRVQGILQKVKPRAGGKA